MNKAEQIEEMANMIWAKGPLEAAADLYSAGYRKVTKPPPVLTDEEHAKVLTDLGEFATYHNGLRAVKQAQRDADWKTMREEE